MQVDLKPCPFCGSAAKLVDSSIFSVPPYMLFDVVCVNGDCMMSNGVANFANAEDDARKRWNRRANKQTEEG